MMIYFRVDITELNVILTTMSNYKYETWAILGAATHGEVN